MLYCASYGLKESFFIQYSNSCTFHFETVNIFHSLDIYQIYRYIIIVNSYIFHYFKLNVLYLLFKCIYMFKIMVKCQEPTLQKYIIIILL